MVKKHKNIVYLYKKKMEKKIRNIENIYVTSRFQLNFFFKLFYVLRSQEKNITFAYLVKHTNY